MGFFTEKYCFPFDFKAVSLEAGAVYLKAEIRCSEAIVFKVLRSGVQRLTCME